MVLFGRNSLQTSEDVTIDGSSRKTNHDEYLEYMNAMGHEHGKDDYFYDGVEEILMHSDDEGNSGNDDDDERLPADEGRMSFTREQLLEYQQLTKLLRFVKVSGEGNVSSSLDRCVERWSMYNDSLPRSLARLRSK